MTEKKNQIEKNDIEKNISQIALLGIYKIT